MFQKNSLTVDETVSLIAHMAIYSLPPGELVGSLVLLSGPVDCNEPSSVLLGGYPNLKSNG